MTTLWITPGNICTKKVHHFCNMHRYLGWSCYFPVQLATTCFRKARRTLIQLWSDCPNTDREEGFWGFLHEMFFKTHGIDAFALAHGFFSSRQIFFHFSTTSHPPTHIVPTLFLHFQTISDTSQENTYCRFELDLFFIAAPTSCVCCTICWLQPLPCWAISTQQLPHRVSVLVEWDH